MEIVDRALVIGAQGLLALLPILVVLAAFFPAAATDVALQTKPLGGTTQP